MDRRKKKKTSCIKFPSNTSQQTRRPERKGFDKYCDKQENNVVVITAELLLEFVEAVLSIILFALLKSPESNIVQSQASGWVKIIHRRAPCVASGALTTVWSGK